MDGWMDDGWVDGWMDGWREQGELKVQVMKSQENHHYIGFFNFSALLIEKIPFNVNKRLANHKLN